MLRNLLRAIVLTVVAILSPTRIVAQRSNVVISPGLRVGLCVGEKTSFTLGGEFSLLFSSNGTAPYTGGVLDVDLINFRRVRLHVGAEFLFVELGTSTFIGGDSTRNAVDLSLFFPIAAAGDGSSGAYAEYTYCWIRRAPDVHFVTLSVKGYSPHFEVPKVSE